MFFQKGLRIALLLAWVGLLAVFPQTVLGQGGGRGTVVGTVTDPSGAVVAGVNVAVTNLGTGIEQTFVTGATGVYSVPNLQVGNYRIVAEATGFKKAVVENIRLEVGATYRADIIMQLGEITAEVAVEAATPVLKTDSAEVSHVIEQRRIVDLPLNGRDYQQLQMLEPGSVNTFNFQTSAGLGGGASSITINNTMIASNGSRPGNQLFLIDGANASSQHGRATILAPSVDAIEEFRLAGSNFSAEYGYGTNVINVSTKSGSNAFHGGLWEFHRNDSLAARSFFAPKVEDLKRNQFGGGIGGPILKNRSFFYFNYEGQREIQGRTTLATVATAKMRAGDLSEFSSQIYDPLTSRKNANGVVVRDPFPGNIIPKDRIDPVSTLFLEWIPLPNTPGIAGNFSNQPKVDNNYNQWSGKIDHKLTENDSLMGRYSYQRASIPSGVGPYRGFSKDDYDPGTTPKTGNGTSAVLSWFHTFSPTTQLELRSSFGRTYSLIDNPNIQDIDWTAQAGIQGFGPGISDRAPSFPTFSYAGFTGLPGGGFNLLYVANNYDFIGNLSMVRGKHTIKTGYTHRFWQQIGASTGSPSGGFTYNGSWTGNPVTGASGNGLADYILGLPFSGDRFVSGVRVYGRMPNSWSYVQDDWKVTPKLTVNLGLRYEVNFPTFEKRDQIVNWVPDARNGRGAIVMPTAESISQRFQDLQPMLRYGLEAYGHLLIFANEAGLPVRSLRFTNYQQFAPRIGVAWRPREDLVIRTGYGIYYVQLDGNRQSETVTAPLIVRESGHFNNADDNGRPTATTQTVVGGVRLGPIPEITARSPWDNSFGYSQQWNLTVQKLLPGNFSAEVAYLGTKGTNLEIGRNRNAPLPGPGTIQSRRPFPEFGNVGWDEQSASSIYHAFQSKLERRFEKGFTLLGSFTWSKTIDDGSAAQGGRNPFIPRFDRGLSDFDVPFNFTLSAIYELPFQAKSASPVLRQVVGGWTVGTIVSLQSGFPFTPGWSGDVSNTGLGARPIRTCDGKLENPTVDRWFDSSCFVTPAQFTFGNSGRNILRGDSVELMDFAIYKSFVITESHRLQFRAEFFNALNHPNFALPTATVNVPTTTGRVFNASPGRIVQFGLKYNF